jgi:hypothetical protein
VKNTVCGFYVWFLLPLSLSAQHAPWEKTAGPPGLTVKVIYKTNNIVYAGTDTQGIYKSTDDGLSWSAANNGIERASISDMIVSGGNLLAAVSSGCPSLLNVFKSTDNGETWSGTTGLAGKVVRSFAIKSPFLYAMFAALPGDSGIARSTDNGNTWQVIPSIITNAGKSIVSDNAIIVAEDNFIWRSTDDGASWDVVEQFALTGISSFAKPAQSYLVRPRRALRHPQIMGRAGLLMRFPTVHTPCPRMTTRFTSVPAARFSNPLTLGGLG